MTLTESNNRTGWLMLRSVLLASVAVLPMLVAAPGISSAQTLNDRLAARQGESKSRMLVDAREVIYDRDNDKVTASGDVQIYYQGKVLEADRVIYNRKAKRVYAEGNAKLTEADGTKTYGDRFDLTDDFRDGFIDSLRVETPEGTRLSSPRAERRAGETTVLDRGTYTACKPCAENPERPPLWQVKSARIIHNNTEQRIYYENSTLEFWGIPVAYIPFFSAPDPSVARASGILAPRIINKTNLGRGLGLPLYWAMAQNYDITFTPTYLSRQGVHLDVLWRHRLEHGSYNIRANGIRQAEPNAFATQPLAGAGLKTWRGSIETRGKFHLNEKWNVGWDAAWASDKHYFVDYKTKPQSLSTMFFSESISQVWLRGRGERSWFDLTGYRYLGLSVTDWQKQIERVPGTLDFERRFTPDLMGGEIKLRYNAVALQRDAAVYQALPNSQSGVAALTPGNANYVPSNFQYDYHAGGTYMPCRYIRGGETTPVGTYKPGQCILRGFAGEYVRNTAEIDWQRRFIDLIGQEWTPFFSLRADAAWLRVKTHGMNNPSQGDAGLAADPSAFAGQAGYRYGNDAQSFFFNGNSDNIVFRAMPAVGLEYRYPFFAQTNWGTHFFEPMAQAIFRPNESHIGKLPNEDAQSLVFDENSIFSRNKFSGYDRVEGGSRLNYGARYTFKSNGDFFATAMFGQSLQLFGRNSFAQYDLANTGRNSGLETRRSDYVSALTIQPFANTSFTARGRFDSKSFALQRLDLEATASIGKVAVQGIYTRIAPQPELGYPLRREGIFAQTIVQLPYNFYTSVGVIYDLDRYLADRATAAAAGVPSAYKNEPWRVSSLTGSVGYRDECTDFSISYSRSFSGTLNNTGGSAVQQVKSSATTILMRLVLKDLGETQVSQRNRH